MPQNANFPVQNSSKVYPVFMSEQALFDEGALFVATNPTPGTGIATTTSVVDDAATQSSTHAQASPVLVIQNQWTASDPNARIIYPRSLNMLLTSIPTSATSWQMSLRMDNNPGFITTAGTAITPVNLNLNSGGASKALIQFGAITTTIINNAGRLVARRQVNSAIPVAQDQWFFSFGSALSSDQIAGGAGAKNVVLSLPVVGIPPGWNLRVDMWGAANAAAPAWEFELVYAERIQGQ